MATVNIGEKVFKRMTEHGLSFAELARKANCSDEHVRKIANGSTQVSLRIASGLSKALSVPLDWLADDAADWPPPASDEQKATDIVKELLASRGVGGDLTDDERQCLAAFRAMDEMARQKTLGFMGGVMASRSPVVPSRDVVTSPRAALPEVSPEDRRKVESIVSRAVDQVRERKSAGRQARASGAAPDRAVG